MHRLRCGTRRITSTALGSEEKPLPTGFAEWSAPHAGLQCERCRLPDINRMRPATRTLSVSLRGIPGQSLPQVGCRAVGSLDDFPYATLAIDASLPHPGAAVCNCRPPPRRRRLTLATARADRAKFPRSRCGCATATRADGGCKPALQAHDAQRTPDPPSASSARPAPVGNAERFGVLRPDAAFEQRTHPGAPSAAAKPPPDPQGSPAIPEQ